MIERNKAEREGAKQKRVKVQETALTTYSSIRNKQIKYPQRKNTSCILFSPFRAERKAAMEREKAEREGAKQERVKVQETAAAASTPEQDAKKKCVLLMFSWNINEKDEVTYLWIR